MASEFQSAPPFDPSAGDQTEANSVEAQGSASGTTEATAQALELARAEVERLNFSVKDMQLRHLAELDNLRKRHIMQLKQARQFGLEPFLKTLLPILDSLEGAIACASPESQEGLHLIHTQFLTALKTQQVGVIDTAGVPFDPQLHHAMKLQPTQSEPDQQVVEILQKGYRLHDRLLRPALVVVTQHIAATDPISDPA